MKIRSFPDWGMMIDNCDNKEESFKDKASVD